MIRAFGPLSRWALEKDVDGLWVKAARVNHNNHSVVEVGLVFKDKPYLGEYLNFT